MPVAVAIYFLTVGCNHDPFNVFVFVPRNSLMLGPAPRLRLYSSPKLYGEVLYGLASGTARRGDDVALLENDIKRLLNIAHAIAMPMARVGIYLAVKHLINPGQKVILSPYTIADVVNMVICAGAVPVFADIDRASCNISPESVAQLIDQDTGAVLVTHLYGQIADMRALKVICETRNVPMIEDAAQAFGARDNNEFAGTIGKAGVYSFGMYKNVNAFYGGMLVTDDEALAHRVRSEIEIWPYQSLGAFAKKVGSAGKIEVVTWPPIFRTFSFHLFRWAYLNNIDAINNRLKIDLDPQLKTTIPASYRCRLTPLQARLIRGQLKHVEAHAKARLESARLYHEHLADIDDLIIAPLFEGGQHIYWYYPIQYRNRWGLAAHVMRQGRDITLSYHRNCASMPCFREYARHCPNAQATADSLIYLATYPRYAKEEVHKTVRAIRSYFGR